MERKLANPASLGLIGFGIPTILFNIHTAGFFPIGPMILATGFFYGGIVQIIAGLLEFKKGNTFGMTAFISYGSFWLTLVIIEALRNDNPIFIGWYLFIWGLFTIFMWIGTFGKSRALQFFFLTTFVFFILLAIKNWTSYHAIGIFAGWEGILCGASAIYLAMADLINESLGRTILPIGKR